MNRGVGGCHRNGDQRRRAHISVVVPLTEPEVAVMVVLPNPVLVAKPLLPAVLLIEDTLAAEEFQVTESVRNRVLPSLDSPGEIPGSGP